MENSESTNIKGAVHSLLEALSDKDELVRDTIRKTLYNIASTDTVSVVDTLYDFQRNKPNLPVTHTAENLCALDSICSGLSKQLSKENIANVVSLSIHEMTNDKDFVPSVQTPASGILVSIANVDCDLVFKSLLDQIKPGVVPHYMVPHTIGTLASTYVDKMVPFLKDALSKILPILCIVKIDGMKQAFAYACGNIASAILEFSEENDNIAVKDNFEVEMSVLFDILFDQWMLSHEPKVVSSVLKAVGPIFRFLSDKRKDEHKMQRVITVLLSFLKKPNLDTHCVSQCLSCIYGEFSVGLKINEHTLDASIHSIFNGILIEPNYGQPNRVKNHFELLRCIDYIIAYHCDKMSEFIFQQMKNNNEEERMKAVIVSSHLISSSPDFLESNSSKLISSLKVMIVMEQNLKMKRVLVKAIVDLIYRKGITENDIALLEFIISNCCLKYYSAKGELDELRKVCGSSLSLLSLTIASIKPFLYPLLIKAFMRNENIEGCSKIMECLLLMLADDQSMILQASVSEPTNEAIFVRCITLLADASNTERIEYCLKFLKIFCGNIHKNLESTLGTDTEKLLNDLGNKDFNIEQWDQLVLNLFVSTIDYVDDNKWVALVSDKITEQIPLNKDFILQKGVLYRCLAFLVCYMVDTQQAEEKLNILLSALQNGVSVDSKYIADAIGIASRKHGYFIIQRLDVLYKEAEAKKNNRFINFISMKQSKVEDDVSTFRGVLFKCYGAVASQTLDSKVVLYLSEVTSVRLIDVLKNSPNTDLTLTCLMTIYHIACALKPAPHHDVALKNRWEILHIILDILYNRSSNEKGLEVFSHVVQAVMAIVKLPSDLKLEERNAVLRTLISKIFSEFSNVKMNCKEIVDDRLAKNMNDSFNLLNNLIVEFILQSTCLSTIDDMLGLLEEWVFHENGDVRLAALMSVKVILEAFIKNVQLNYETPSKFSQIGTIMGVLVPRCMDTSVAVRIVSIDCIRILINIHDLYEGKSTSNEHMRRLSNIQSKISSDDLESVSATVTDLADIIGKTIPHHQTMQFIDSLLNGLSSEELSTRGANIVLNVFINIKGQDLYQNIGKIMENVLLAIEKIEGSGNNGLFEVVLTLTKYHPNAVTSVILMQPLPYESHVSDCWKFLTRDANIAAEIINIFLRMTSSVDLYDTPLKFEEAKVAALQPLAAVSALKEMFLESATREICINKFADIFAMLFTTFASYVGTSPPAHTASVGVKNEKYGFIPNRHATKLSPARIALDTFREFLVNVECEQVANACKLCTQIETGEDLSSFLDMTPVLVSQLCHEAPQYLSKVVASLNEYTNSQILAQRLSVMAFFGEFMHYRCNDDPVLVEIVIGTLSAGWKDKSADVRAISLYGLANINKLTSDLQCHHITSVVKALNQGLDDQQGSSLRTNVPLAAMSGMISLLDQTEQLNTDSLDVFWPAAQKIKPYMNTDSSVLREASIKLFGVLTAKLNKSSVTEQALYLLPCFLLHLCDDDGVVVRVSKGTLKQILPLLNAPKANLMVQNHLLPDGKLNFDSFIADLLENVCQELPEHVFNLIEYSANYLNSPQNGIRAHAPLFIGELFSRYIKYSDGHTKQANEKQVWRQIVTRLMQLLKDKVSLVRTNAAKALGFMYQRVPLEQE